MDIDDFAIINWDGFAETRKLLGSDLVRILGYFREDGYVSVAAIEEALRRGSAVDLVMPAHRLKGEAAQFCGESLEMLAEHIEMTARLCVETQQSPDELVPDVVRLRPLFEKTLDALDAECNPLVTRRGTTAARPAMVANQAFGRL